MNIYDYLMYLGFYYSDSIFRLCYDKFIRPELYNKILSSKHKELLSQDPSEYLKIKWISENDLDNVCIEEGSENDLLALKYLKNSIRFFKIYAIFSLANFMTMLSFVMNYKAIKRSDFKRKYYTFFVIFAVFIETPYLVIGMKRSDQNKLEEIYNKEIEKVKMFYKI